MPSKSAEQIRKEMRARKPAPTPPALPTSSPLPPSDNGVHEPSERTLSQPVPQSARRTQTRSREPDLPRQVPHDMEAEKGILGSMLNEPAYAIPYAIRRVTSESFHIPAHQMVFIDLIAHFHETPRLDIITFGAYLKKVGHLETVGGPSFVTSLFTFVTTAAAIEYYADIVQDKKVLRDLAAFGDKMAADARESGADRMDLVAVAHKQIEKVRLEASGESENVESFGFGDLLGFDPATDPNILVGSGRWLCRGFTCLWAGAAGAGKSTLEMQLAIYWGCGLPCFGIKPVRPLKSLIVQAENDLGDTGEQLQGVMEGIRKAGDADINGRRRELIEKNVVIKRVIGCTGPKFLALLESLIQTERPELVWIDPLFAFAGCDLKEAKDASALLREGIIPIAVRNQVCVHVIHHVGKPDKDSAAKSHWADIDFQYLGFGSSEIQNAFRAVNVMLPVPGEDRVFRLILSKRGNRAGAKDTDGEFTTNLYLTHAKEGICWLQVPKPDDQSKDNAGMFNAKFKAIEILDHLELVDGIETAPLQRRVCGETGMSKQTFYRLFGELKKAEKVELAHNGGWIRKAPSK